MPLSDEAFLDRLQAIVRNARAQGTTDTTDSAFRTFSYYLSIEIIPLLMEKLSDTTAPADLIDFMERYYIAAKRGNEKIFARWKAGSPMNAFLSRRQVQSYKVPDEVPFEYFDEEQSQP